MRAVFHFRLLAAVLTGCMLLAGPCHAAPPLALPAGADFSVLPPPPADDSPAGLADLGTLLYIQSNRTPEQVKQAQALVGPSAFAMGQEILGPWFTRDNLPETAKILRQITKITDPVLKAAKAEWKRPRPFERSAEIAPVVKKPQDAGSYPSGHVFGISLPMLVLSAAFPGHEAAFEERIRRVMWGRVVGGVHYPTDTEAGRLLAKDLVSKLLATPEMKEALEAIRAEAAPFLAKSEPAVATPR